MSVTTRVLTGESLAAALDDVARLRIAMPMRAVVMAAQRDAVRRRDGEAKARAEDEADDEHGDRTVQGSIRQNR